MGVYGNIYDRLHTKLYLNESKVILSSLNLLDSSKDKNYELGYTIDGKYHSKQFIEKVIEKDILALEPTGTYGTYWEEYLNAKHNPSKMIIENNSIQTYGYCIRCGREVPFDTRVPYCGSCYKTWLGFKKRDYQENYCHKCNNKVNSSMEKPFCDTCGH